MVMARVRQGLVALTPVKLIVKVNVNDSIQYIHVGSVIVTNDKRCIKSLAPCVNNWPRICSAMYCPEDPSDSAALSVTICTALAA